MFKELKRKKMKTTINVTVLFKPLNKQRENATKKKIRNLNILKPCCDV